MVAPLPLDQSQIARAAEEMIAEYGVKALTKADDRVALARASILSASSARPLLMAHALQLVNVNLPSVTCMVRQQFRQLREGYDHADQ